MRRLVLAGAVGLLAAAGAAYLLWGGESSDPASPPPAAARRLGLALEPGTSARLRFTLEHQGRVPISPELPMDLELSLAGELRLLGLEEADGRRQTELTLLSIERAVFRMGGGDLLKGQALVGSQVLVLSSDSGALVELRFAPQTPPEAERLLHLLVLESQLEIAPAFEWTRREHHSLGEAEVRYTRTETGIRRAIERHLRFGGLESEDLSELHAEAETRFELAPTGALRRIHDAWRYRGPAFGGEKRFTLEVLDATRAQTAAWVGRAGRYAETRSPGETRTSTNSLESALIQRAAGLTQEQCIADLIAHEISGRIPDHDRWLWRASGLLRLQPELAAKLVPLLSRKTMSSAGRALVLDLLAHVGHAEAQAALRAGLQLAAVKADPDFHLLYQRLSFVTEPDADTRAFVQEGWSSARPEHRSAAAHALGSVAGASHRAGDRDEALALTEPLVEALASEESPERQAELLGALGNAGLPEHAEMMLGYVRSPSPEVRYQMAGSLRKLEGEPVTRALVELATDPSGAPTQRRALATLDQRTVEDGAFGELCERVRRGEFAPESHGVLVTVLARRLPDLRARAALEFLLYAPDTMTDVRARIRSVLTD